MKITIRISPSKLFAASLIVALATVYLWNTLPEMDTIYRLSIIGIAIVLVFILGAYLQNSEEQKETSLKRQSIT